MRRSFSLVALVCAVLLTAVGVAHAAPASTGSSSTTVVLTNVDDGSSITVGRGDTVVVRLHSYRSGSVTWDWSEPESSAPEVLQKVGGGSYAGGDAYATFTAVAAGTAELSAFRTCHATGDMACVAAAFPWTVDVTVTE